MVQRTTSFNAKFKICLEFREEIILTSFGVWLSAILWPSKRNLSEFMGTPCLWQYDSLSFLRCVVIFTLKWLSLLSCLMTLSLIYSSSFLSPKSLVEGFASWSDMVTVVPPGVSAHQRPRVGRTSLRGLQIRLSTGQHNTAAGGTSITPCVTSLQHHLSHSKKKKEREILGCESSIVSYNAQKNWEWRKKMWLKFIRNKQGVIQRFRYSFYFFFFPLNPFLFLKIVLL